MGNKILRVLPKGEKPDVLEKLVEAEKLIATTTYSSAMYYCGIPVFTMGTVPPDMFGNDSLVFYDWVTEEQIIDAIRNFQELRGCNPNILIVSEVLLLELHRKNSVYSVIQYYYPQTITTDNTAGNSTINYT